MIPLSDRKTNIFPFITILLIIANVIVFIAEITTGNGLDTISQAFVEKYALVPAEISLSNPESLYTFFTSMFLHGGPMHIISNMWYLWIFGDNVEEEMGSFVYLWFYLFGGLFASLLQYLFTINSTIPSLGASGAISALLGFYMIAFPYNKIKILYIPLFGGFLRKGYVSASYMLLYWGLLQFVNSVGWLATGNSGGVAWLAHLGGFAFGVIVAKIWRSENPDMRNRWA
jgi:membrane associated rhomboid family serine protease